MDFYTYRVKLDSKRGIDSVYDGDTISNLEIDMGFKIKYVNSFRIMGIDTPELRTKDKIEKIKGYQARTMLRLLIGDKDLAIKSTTKNKTTVTVKRTKWQSFCDAFSNNFVVPFWFWV